ncbi:hypothetical protein GCM10027051_31830 [Niabella terrae]
MKEYSFLIPNRKRFSYQVLAYGILILNGLAYFFYGLREKGHYGYLVLLGVLLIAIAFNYYQYKKTRQHSSVAVWLILPAILWGSAGELLPAALNILFWALYRISVRPLRLTVDGEGIRYPSFPQRHYPWPAVRHILLKDDILTLELASNKIYQHLVTEDVTAVNEQEFNDFCSQLLKV